MITKNSARVYNSGTYSPLPLPPVGLTPDLTRPAFKIYRVVFPPDYRLRVHRYLAVGSVQQVHGDGKSGSETSQRLDNLNPFLYRGDEMRCAFQSLCLIYIVRSYPEPHQALYQGFHYRRLIVYSPEEYRLVAQVDSGISQSAAGLLCLFGQLRRMIELGIEPEGVVLFQYRTQFLRDSLRHGAGSPRTDSDNLNVRNFTKTAQNLIYKINGIHQRVAAGYQDVPDFGCTGDVIECGITGFIRKSEALTSHHPLTEAVTAQDRTGIGDGPGNPVRDIP